MKAEQIIGADIGGTNANFSLVLVGPGRAKIIYSKKYLTKESVFIDLVNNFLQDLQKNNFKLSHHSLYIYGEQTDKE